MINWTDVTGLLGIVLLVGALLARLLAAVSLRTRRAIVLVCTLVLLVPFGSVSLAEIVRGILGDLSIPVLLLAGNALLARIGYGQMAHVSGNKLSGAGFWILAGLALYPAALGWGGMDPYRWGYASIDFLLVLAGLAGWAWLTRRSAMFWAILLSVAAWSVGWYESTNLWDYLIDPWLFGYVAGSVMTGWIRRRGMPRYGAE